MDLMSNMGEYQTKKIPGRISEMTQDKVKFVCQGATP